MYMGNLLSLSLRNILQNSFILYFHDTLNTSIGRDRQNC